MSLFRCTYPGTPVPQGRARHTRQGIAYTPATTRAAQHNLRAHLIAQAHMDGWQPARGPVTLTVDFSFATPRSWPAWRQEAMRGAPHVSRPDVDNLVKLVLDAARGVLWLDDTQVHRIDALKRYGTAPSTRIFLQAAPELPVRKRDLEAYRDALLDPRSRRLRETMREPSALLREQAEP